ncbi:MAG: hypothetical protein ACYTG0_15960 [Planctomycetota bacterium]|jgi:hypothetical protein
MANAITEARPPELQWVALGRARSIPADRNSCSSWVDLVDGRTHKFKRHDQVRNYYAGWVDWGNADDTPVERRAAAERDD